MVRHRRQLAVVVCWFGVLALLIPAGVAGRTAGIAGTGEAPEELLDRAYDLAYNLDHDDAVESLRRVVDQYPTDPSVHRGLAALTWLRMLFLGGQVLVDSQMTARFDTSGRKQAPPAELDETFHFHIEQAVQLSEEAVKQAPDDPEARYQLGASLALVASYKASIAGEGLRALRDAKRAYTEHQKVLELDPSRKDASFTLGLYRYLVSLLPRPIRMMAYLVGFDGGREEAVRLVEEAAAYPGDTQTEAKFALVLLYNREKEYEQAQHVLTDLKRQYPRNRLVWLESASTWLREDRASMAVRDLSRGFAMLSADQRVRMSGEDELWLLKRGTALVELGRVLDARADLELARNGGATAWIQGRASVELGKIADLDGNRKLARNEYDRGQRLCDQANDRRCVSVAKSLKKQGYSAN